jgi:hypothetical protein
MIEENQKSKGASRSGSEDRKSSGDWTIIKFETEALVCKH